MNHTRVLGHTHSLSEPDTLLFLLLLPPLSLSLSPARSLALALALAPTLSLLSQGGGLCYARLVCDLELHWHEKEGVEGIHVHLEPTQSYSMTHAFRVQFIQP